MTAPASALLPRRRWRRLERSALKGHERDLLHRLRDLAATGPSVLDATGSWTVGSLALQLPGRRLVLGGVSPSAAWALLATAWSPIPARLVKAGRYGRLWWVAVAGEERQVALATHLWLVDDPGRPRPSRRDLPVLSGAH